MTADVQEGAELTVTRPCEDDRGAPRARRRVGTGLRQLAEMPRVLPRGAEDALLLSAQDLRVAVPAVRERFFHCANVSRPYHGGMDAARRAFAFVKKHPRIFIAVQAVILAIFLRSIRPAPPWPVQDARDALPEA